MNMTNLEVTIIGSGRVGTQVALRLHARGVQVVQIYNKTPDRASHIAQQVGARHVITLSELQFNTQSLVILAVKDGAITQVAIDLIPYASDHLVVHTSGTYPVGRLNEILPRVGGFYPLMTFTEGADMPWSSIPIGIAATQKNDINLLRRLAKKIGGKPFQLLDNQRLGLHVSAVIANNFTNQLYRIVFDLLEKNQLDKSLLLPLIRQTAALIEQNDPALLQTGPAVRGDAQTITAHQAFLESEPEYQELYTLMTELIQKK
jgi:predicted short-subunit dehydrogenase-like oxidoreductase (DUF2520 family)